MARLSDLGVDFDHWCFACGRQNPIGLRLEFDVACDRAETTFTGERRHQGYDGALHGGIVTALLDEAMGWAIFHAGVWAVTGRLSVSFRQPAPVGEPVRASGEITRDRSRAIETRGTLVRASSGEVLATASAVFIRLSEERRVALARQYGTSDETFARVRKAVAMEATMKGSQR